VPQVEHLVGGEGGGGGGRHRVRCGLLWNSTGSGAEGRPPHTRVTVRRFHPSMR
jgi:hypothetical protein